MRIAVILQLIGALYISNVTGSADPDPCPVVGGGVDAPEPPPTVGDLVEAPEPPPSLRSLESRFKSLVEEYLRRHDQMYLAALFDISAAQDFIDSDMSVFGAIVPRVRTIMQSMIQPLENFLKADRRRRIFLPLEDLMLGLEALQIRGSSISPETSAMRAIAFFDSAEATLRCPRAHIKHLSNLGLILPTNQVRDAYLSIRGGFHTKEPEFIRIINENTRAGIVSPTTFRAFDLFMIGCAKITVGKDEEGYALIERATDLIRI